MNQLFQDLRYTMRQLRKSPGFTLTSVITLALGIGATTAIFTLVHAVLLKSLPVTKPDELWRIGKKVHCCNWGGYTQWEEFSLFNNELYHRFKDNTPAFAELAAFQGGNASLGVRRAGSTQPAETRNGQFVSGNFFSTFGVGAWAGRLLNPSDDREGAPPVAVLSYHAWQEKFGADPSVVGSVFLFNNNPFTIVGVAAPGFFGADLRGWAMPEIWMPLSAEPLIDSKPPRLTEPRANWLDIIGRVKPGTDPKALEAQLRTELRQWQMSHYSDLTMQDKEYLPKQQMFLTPGGAGVTDMREQYEDALRVLLIAAACVLLIACANLANLLLARGLRRRQQTSLRIALGASRGTLVRKALVESLTLGVVGGGLGLLVAYMGTSLVLKLAFTGPNFWVPIDATPSVPVLLFALGISLLTGVLFGIAPAWTTSHAEPVEALRGANRSTEHSTRWSQKALVVAQASISLVLISSAVMLAQSLRNLKNQNFGFDVEGRYMISLDVHQAGYKPEQLELIYRRIFDRILQIPGVQGVAGATYAPMSGDSWNDGIRIQGKPEPHSGDDDGATFTRVTPEFFSTLNNRIVMGRAIDEHDTKDAPLVAVVNEAFAKKFLKGENPIGKRFGENEMIHAGDYQIVGVAADMRYLNYGFKDPDRPMYFLPTAQHTPYTKPNEIEGEKSGHYLENLILWAPGKPEGLEMQVRKALSEIDPNIPLLDFASYHETLARDFGQQDMIAKLTLIFGVLALGLAAIGLYGVMSYSVEQRTSEIGIRMALGANRGTVLGMVLRSAFLQVAIGLAIGIPTAILAGRAITDQLYAVKPYDPVILSLAVIVLGAAALIAAAIPARRAVNVNPTEALRAE
ncbi:ABC transporter permease [Occallatibacter riparius]|uniref:ABC transporter permease n=1 Tax=Occallatibacter riparius TaxID=1002689 RepID=A0A9J7BUU7_9BACT|nr:ABC transporter permease [Occallatibacter riparius]UWZ86652.1 ABC transporter permease [Occallatibacter riparius]